MTIPGVDYSKARPDPACLFKSGKRFAVRYTSIGDSTKNITLAEARKLVNAGLRIVTIFEESAGHMRGGAQAGTAAAKASQATGKAAGMHPRAPHLFACDEDTSGWGSREWEAADAYLQAARAVLGNARVGGYGDVRFIEKLGHLLAVKWQTYAWSGGRWSSGLHLKQYKNNVTLCGGAVDLDDALTSAYGQWGPNVYDGIDLKRAQMFARSCDPIPYRMTLEISRQGIDCSGFMSAIINSLMGKDNVWVRLFATGNIASLVDNGSLPMIHKGLGDVSDFNIGVMYPSESSSRIGHTAGTLGGLDVESRGGYGVLVGADARSAINPLFKHHFHVKVDNVAMAATNTGGLSVADVADILAKLDALQKDVDTLKGATLTTDPDDKVIDEAVLAQRRIRLGSDRSGSTPHSLDSIGEQLNDIKAALPPQ